MTSKTLWGTFWSPSGTLKWLWICFLVFWESLGNHLGTPGAHLGSIWAPLGATWANLGSIFVTFEHFGSSPGPFWQLWSNKYEKVQKLIENGTRNEGIFDDILSLCEKWQTAFGLRLRGRIGVRASCFHPLGVNLCPLFFSRFFGRENAVGGG